MKKLVALAIIALLFTLSVNAQEENIVIEGKNEISLDITSFAGMIRYQFTGYDYDTENFNSIYPFYSNNPFYLSYKRKFNNSAIRVGFGALISKNTKQVKNPEADTKDQLGYYNFRIGYEHQKDLSKRWKINYGIDFISSIHISKREDNENFFPINSSEQVIENVTRENHTITYGIGPVLGIRYKLNSNIELGTETSWTISHLKSTWEYKHEVDTENSYKTNSRAIVSNFIIPFNLFLAINF